MSQDCWGPSPEDIADGWRWRMDREKEVRRIEKEMEASLKGIMGRKKFTIDELRKALDAEHRVGIRDEAFRGGFWGWLAMGVIEMDGHSPRRLSYVFHR